MDIETWVYQTFGEVLTYGMTDLRVNCPFCPEPDTNHHLYISLVKDAVHCFRCDYKSTRIGLIMDHDGVSFSEAKAGIATQIVPLYELLERRGERQGKIELEGLFTPMPRDPPAEGMPKNFMTINAALIDHDRRVRDDGTRAFNYLCTRMCGKYTRREVGKRFGDWWGIWRYDSNRLVIPVEAGWWMSRRLSNGIGAKYLNCRNPKGNYLYNYKALDRYDLVHIAEGAFSAEFIGPNTVALCGKKATPEQQDRLKNSRVKRFVICLDAGTNGETADLADALYRSGKNVDVRIYSSGDPASSIQYKQSHWDLTTRLKVAWNLI